MGEEQFSPMSDNSPESLGGRRWAGTTLRYGADRSVDSDFLPARQCRLRAAGSAGGSATGDFQAPSIVEPSAVYP
ncbi:hypothetical protein Poly21_45580 [Allorhodopirellula heiligendammensis]|uniref:Uncharacterized protein n=1 Tax=Allorhodopirellula heiligendammensis TaxID=2714739 RepID=A0A5C6BG37_9BACT|nr:hypothetical protein Poly21_45580 [Allorhodopirellula heiligendammensis]